MKKNIYIRPQQEIFSIGDVVLLSGSGDVTEGSESNTVSGTVTGHENDGGEFGYGGEQGGTGDAPAFGFMEY